MSLSFKDLRTWQEANRLALSIYKVTQAFPVEERFGLINQLRRASISVISNIAEGQSRESLKDFIHFLVMARGSLAEIEAQLIISHQLGYISQTDFDEIDETRQHTMNLLCRLINSLKEKADANNRTTDNEQQTTE